MIILLLGTALNVILNAVLVYNKGIIGAAIGTTLTTFILMVVIMYFVIKNTKISIPWKNILLILTANVILTLVCLIIPKSIIGSIIGLILGSLTYIIALIMLNVLTKRNLNFFAQYLNKIPLIKGYSEKIVKYIEKKELIYKIED